MLITYVAYHIYEFHPNILVIFIKKKNNKKTNWQPQKYIFCFIWLNEVGFMGNSFNYGYRMVFSNIRTQTHDSGYQ